MNSHKSTYTVPFAPEALTRILPILLLTTLLSAASLSSCSDDDNGSRYPSVRTELVEASTNSSKDVVSILLDDGTRYGVSRAISSSTADTVFRCVCTFDDKEGQSEPDIYSIYSIPSGLPLKSSQVEQHKDADYDVISTWITPRYINAFISFKTTGNGQHKIYFIEDSLNENSDGTHTAHVSLVHERPEDDPESYTERTYVSLPLWHYESTADTVKLSLSGTVIQSPGE